MFDSTAETLKHIRKVDEYMSNAAMELLRRGIKHDESKLHEPEKALFDEMTPLLPNLKFGSPEYTESVKKLKPALDHHYANNSHHPQHYENGINGMDLFDLMEMFWDWKASGERGKDGNIFKSIDIQTGRFGISKQLRQILINTAKRYTNDTNG
jgi:hypothetical protein